MHDRGLARRLHLVGVAVASVAACGQATPSGGPTPPATTPASVPVSAPATVAPTATLAPPESVEPEPTDTDTGSPGTPPCAVAELKASRGIIEIDADERTTEVVLVAAGTCSVDAFPSLLLRDADGRVLVTASSAGPGGIDLVGGVAYMSEVRLSNWCLAETSYPVTIGIVHGTATLPVTGDSFPDEGDLPPCAHEDAGPVLSGTAWQPSP